MDIKDLKKIINLMKSSDISEIELEEEGKKVRIVRGKYDLSDIKYLLQTVPFPSAATLPLQSEHSLPKDVDKIEKAAASEKPESSKLVQINSPMVGTFYVAPSPDSPAYVRVGDIVKKGDVLCVIEAMKLMNEIESEVDGKIVSLMVKNAQPVEYGQPLFLVDPQ